MELAIKAGIVLLGVVLVVVFVLPKKEAEETQEEDLAAVKPATKKKSRKKKKAAAAASRELPVEREAPKTVAKEDPKAEEAPAAAAEEAAPAAATPTKRKKKKGGGGAAAVAPKPAPRAQQHEGDDEMILSTEQHDAAEKVTTKKYDQTAKKATEAAASAHAINGSGSAAPSATATDKPVTRDSEGGDSKRPTGSSPASVRSNAMSKKMDDLKALTVRVTEERRLEECPICIEQLPDLWLRGIKGQSYLCVVCGKSCCRQCTQDYAKTTHTQNNGLSCPLCRNPAPSTEKERFEILVSRAKAGQPFAQRRVADGYRKGVGVRGSRAKALWWYEKALNQGHFEASESLGMMYSSGGGEDDLDRAREYFELAAASNDAGALHSLAVCMIKQSDDNENPSSPTVDDLAKRIDLLRRSAEEGLDVAQRDLALHYYRGNGVPLSLPDALRWCLKAAEQGCPASVHLASGIIYKMRGYDEIAKIVYWLRKGVAMNDPTCKEELGRFEERLNERCARCQKEKSSSVKLSSRCSRCAARYFCGKDCQLADWSCHKQKCIPKDLEKRSSEDRSAFFMS